MAAAEARPRTRRRRWWLALAAALAVGVIVWQGLERVLDVDAYRPQVVAEIERWSGQPASVGRLDLAWRPVPCLSAIDVTIGKGDLALTTERVDVFPSLRALLGRRIVIRRINLDALALTLPPSADGIGDAWDALLAQIRSQTSAPGTQDSSPGAIRGFALKRIVAGDATLRLGADARHPIELGLRAEGITEPTLELALDAEVPSLGIRADGELAIPLGGEGGLAGTLRFDGVRPDRFVALPEALHAAWGGRLTIEPRPEGALGIALDGEAEPAAERAPAASVAASATLAAEGGAELTGTIAADGLTAEFEGARGDAGDATLRIAALDAQGPALAALLAALASDPLGLVAADAAALAARGVELARPADAPWALVAGALEGQGLAVHWQGEPIAEPLALAARAADGAIEIERIEGGSIALAGRIAPEPDWSHAALVLQGRAALGDALLAPFLPDVLREVGGALELDELRLAFGDAERAEDEPALAARGRLVGGRVAYVSEAFRDRLSEIQLALSNRGAGLRVDGSARSATLGPLGIGATIQPDARRVRGRLEFDAAAAGALLTDASTRALAEPVLLAYGPGRLGFLVEWPEDEDLRVQLERAGSPALDASFRIATGEGGGLGALEARATLPGDALRGLLPKSARTQGHAAIRVKRSGAQQRLRVDADLDGLGLAFGRFVEKRPGEPLALTLRADAAWTLERIELSAPDATLALEITEDGVRAPALDLDLAKWKFLLVDSAAMSGRIRGSLDTASSAGKLALDGVALALSPTLELESASGVVELAGDDWTLRDLRLRGARSDAVVDATLVGGRIEGGVHGAMLDVNLVQAVVEEIGEMLPESDPSKPPAVREGALEVRLDRVVYGRGEARKLRTDLRWSEGDLVAHDLSFDSYEGRVSGTLEIDVRDADPSVLTLDLALENVTGRFLDDLFSPDAPRGVRGVFDGTLRFSAPLTGDARSMWAAANGELRAKAREGSFGKLGVATQLTTVLRSSEALRLKLPTFRDEGLVFDAFAADVTLTDGRAEITTLTLDSSSYAATARGYLDFRKDESRVPIVFDAIKGLTGLVQWIPVAGDALKLVSVRLTGSGSPFDLKIGIASVTDQLIGATMVGPNAVIKGARDVLNVLRGATGSGATKPEPGAEPEPAAPSEPVTEPEPAPPQEPATEPQPAPPQEPATEPESAPPQEPATEPEPIEPAPIEPAPDPVPEPPPPAG